MSLRSAAEAVLAKWDEDGFIGIKHVDALRAALSAPDEPAGDYFEGLQEGSQISEREKAERAEAIEIIRQFESSPRCMDCGAARLRARDFLKRTEGQT